MSELRDLYQEVIFDHNRKPRNFGPLPEASHAADGFNPLCGDKVTVRLRVEGGKIADVRFEGAGCAISTASASLMTEALKGLTLSRAEDLFGRFHQMATAKEGEPDPELGKLVVLAGVREFPTRVKCATLAWHTLQAALHGGGTVSTE